MSVVSPKGVYKHEGCDVKSLHKVGTTNTCQFLVRRSVLVRLITRVARCCTKTVPVVVPGRMSNNLHSIKPDYRIISPRRVRLLTKIVFVFVVLRPPTHNDHYAARDTITVFFKHCCITHKRCLGNFSPGIRVRNPVSVTP